MTYPRTAPRSRTKSEWCGLSTSTVPQGYTLARTGSPSISTSSSDPITAKGSKFYANPTRALDIANKAGGKDILLNLCYPQLSPRHLPQCHMGSYRLGSHSGQYPP